MSKHHKTHEERLAQRKEKIRGVGVSVLTKLPTISQVGIMSAALHTGRLKADNLRQALENNAPTEMHKGALKLRDKSRAITVDALLEEYRGDKAFQELAAEVGLDEGYFEKLAENEAGKW